MILELPLFQQALPLIKKINAHGYEAFFVGGAVRDALLKKPISDIDIATSATPNEIKALFHTTVDVGIEHGTLLVIENGITYEITTFRTEGDYIDYRRPSTVAFVRNLKEDLQRRDFTINALALSETGDIIDYFAGQKDLQERRIRAVGQASERFAEDALRMVRAIRFVGQLDFELEHLTEAAIVEHRANLAKIATERIRIEWMKTLMSPFRQRALTHLLKTRLYEYFPVPIHRQTIEQLASNTTQRLSEIQAWVLLIYYEKNLSIRNYMLQWKCSNKMIRAVQIAFSTLKARLHKKWDYQLAFDCPFELALEVEPLLISLNVQNDEQQMHEMYQTLPIDSIQAIQLNGNDIVNLLQIERPGPIVGTIMNDLKQNILTTSLPNERKALETFVLQHYKNKQKNN